MWGGIDLGKGMKQFIVLKVPKNTVSSIIRKWKEYGTTQTLPRAGCPTKLRNWARRTLVREMTKNPMTKLTELQSTVAEMGDAARGQQSLRHYTNLGFMGESPDGSHSWEKGMWKTLRTWDKRFRGLIRWKLNCLAWMQSTMSVGNRAQLITRLTPSLPWSMVVAASWFGDAFQQQGLWEL